MIEQFYLTHRWGPNKYNQFELEWSWEYDAMME